MQLILSADCGDQRSLKVENGLAKRCMPHIISLKQYPMRSIIIDRLGSDNMNKSLLLRFFGKNWKSPTNSSKRFYDSDLKRGKMPGQLEEIKGRRATFGMGCFWAGDSLFGVLPGVIRTTVGYSGGQKDSPTYRNLGDHTEVIDIEYNPDVISYKQLLALFWQNHEYGLTTKIKRQYMSLILYHDDEQRSLAEKSREEEQRKRGETFMTEIRKFEKFYPAEEYHQKYRLRNHPWLIEITGLGSDEALRTSPLAAKLNGYIAGAGTLEQLEKEVPNLGLSEKAAQYVKKNVIENQGNGLYC